MKAAALLVCTVALTCLPAARKPGFVQQHRNPVSFLPVEGFAASERVVKKPDFVAPNGNPVSAQRPLGAIRGRVEIRRAAAPPERRPAPAELGFPAPRDVVGTRRAVVYLETAPATALDSRDPPRARMDQRNETFLPHVLAVDVGSVVDFPNNDSTYHNVFSLSKAKRFDLGRYARGKSKAVRFDRPGVVRVFCDIHSHMSAFVLVFGHPFYAMTDGDGRYRIDGIPPGTYTVAAWYEGEARETRTVSIPALGGPVDLDFTVR